MLISIALSALCSTLEATLLSTPLSYIAGLEDQGVKGAKRLKRQKTNSDRPISAILCLNTIANTVGASIVGSLVYEVYGDALVGVFSTIFTLCILILSEIIPKTIGTSYWRTLAIPASVIIDGMIFISFPLVWVLEHLQQITSAKRTVGIKIKILNMRQFLRRRFIAYKTVRNQNDSIFALNFLNQFEHVRIDVYPLGITDHFRIHIIV